MEIERRICKVIADVFNLSSEKIDEDSSNESVEEWDSLGQLQVIMAIEKEFNIRFKAAELSELTSIKKLVQRVKALVGT